MTGKPAKVNEKSAQKAKVELIKKLSIRDMNDLCDATDLAIQHDGGFGWLTVPERDVLERFWQGVTAMPLRYLFVARLDDTICGTAQLILPPVNNQAQSHSVQLSSVFLAPWARGYGLAKKLLEEVESKAISDSFTVINLDVRETQKSAISLFENMGYTQCGIHPHYARQEGKDIRGYYYYKKLF